MIVSEKSPNWKNPYLHQGRIRTARLAPDVWPVPTATSWNWASPSVGDIDGDGEEEIVVNALNGVVFAWNADGTEVRDGDSDPATNGPFYVRTGAQWEWSRSGPALYDLDGDGAKDIIFGTKNDDTGTRRLMAIKYDGTDVAGFPYIANGGISVDPCVGDLDNDGQVEIVFFCNNRYVYAVQQDGSDYPGFPVNLGYCRCDMPGSAARAWGTWTGTACWRSFTHPTKIPGFSAVSSWWIPIMTEAPPVR